MGIDHIPGLEPDPRAGPRRPSGTANDRPDETVTITYKCALAAIPALSDGVAEALADRGIETVKNVREADDETLADAVDDESVRGRLAARARYETETSLPDRAAVERRREAAAEGYGRVR